MPGAQISIDDDVVSKLHGFGTDPRALRRRVRVAERSAVLASPLTFEPEPVGDRWLTRWPRLETVPRDPARLPWADAGKLLARLHTETPCGFDLPHGAPARLRRALARLGDGPQSDVIRRAAAGLVAAPVPDRPVTLVHGDFHLASWPRARKGGC